MKKTSVFFGLILAATLASAQEKKPVPAPKTPPVLSDTQKMKYFKALSEYQTASSQAEKANQAAQAKQSALQSAATLVTTVCGKDATVSVDASGDLVCNLKPVEPKKN